MLTAVFLLMGSNQPYNHLMYMYKQGFLKLLYIYIDCVIVILQICNIVDIYIDLYCTKHKQDSSPVTWFKQISV